MRKPDKAIQVSFREERVLHAQGYQFVAGIDEAGRGPLAGPVVAAAVVFPEALKGTWHNEVQDSKLLTAFLREKLYHLITKSAITFGVGIMEPAVIDDSGVAVAARLAMKAAVEQLSPAPQYLLIDYFGLPEVDLPQKGVVDGDTFCFSIACASILAKVTRDHIMEDLDKTYPGYGLAANKGYGTKEHHDSLSRLGPCPIHRKSFEPVRQLLNKQHGT